MKNLSKLVLATVYFSFYALDGSAQQIYTDGIKNVHGGDGDHNRQFYSQARSLTTRLPLDLMAVNDPQQFAGLPVASNVGVEIGRVIAVARRTSDQALHVIINTHAGVPAAIRIDELTLGALAYWDPAGSLHDRDFDEVDFEPVSQYQAGHSAWGALTHPAAGPERAAIDEPTGAADDAPAIVESSVLDAAEGSGSAVPVYQPVGSSVVQLALTHPDAFQEKLLIGSQGELLGQIAYIARHLQNQQLYAVVIGADGTSPTAVKLDALAVASLVSQDPARDATLLAFDEDEFDTVANR